MKKASKPVPKTPAKKAPATKPAAMTPKPKSAAKPKAKPAARSMPRKAQGQGELLLIVERLAQSADKLAQAAERLAEATAPKPPAPPRDEAPQEDFKTIAERAEAAKNENE